MITKVDQPQGQGMLVEADYAQVELRIFSRLCKAQKWYARLYYWICRKLHLKRVFRQAYNYRPLTQEQFEKDVRRYT